MMIDHNEPSLEEKADGVIVKNVRECSICGSPADRYKFHIECQENKNHNADLMTGIFTDMSLDI